MKTSKISTCLLLAQDKGGGLQMLSSVREWIAAPPIPGTFVVNLVLVNLGD